MINIKRLIFLFAFFTCFFIPDEISAQKINQFNEHQQRTGIWKKYYPNKKIRYSGAFKNGKEVGVFKFYENSNSKQPVITKTYSNKKDAVLVQFFTTKGKLQSKGYFIHKKRKGDWVYYFLDGKIMSEEFYKNGKLEGKLVNYYPNGKETEITFYKNGLKDGISQKYSSNGILIEEVTFKDGKLNGLAKYFELNGKIKETGVYQNEKRVGKWEYYLDGEVASDKEIKDHKKLFKKKN